MNVIDLINEANPREVSSIYTKEYKEDGWNKEGTFQKFREILNNIEPKDTEGFSVIVS